MLERRKKVGDVVKQAIDLISTLPVSGASQTTLIRYRRTYTAMIAEPGPLNCLRAGDSRDTYQFRRAALYATSRALLVEGVQTVHMTASAAMQTNPPLLEALAEIQKAARQLDQLIKLVGPAIRLDPPCSPNTSSFAVASRWTAANGTIKRARNSKKTQLKAFGRDWQARLWAATPERFPYRTILAVHLLTPVRPEELVPSERPTGWSPGVIVELLSPSSVRMTWRPAKTHGGKYGSPEVAITLNSALAGDAAEYLASECARKGGHMIVAIASKNAVRKAFGRLGKKAFPKVKAALTPYLFRHQFIADLKATCGAGEAVAAAAGHSVDSTQTHYARRESGNRRRGIIKIHSARRPRPGNIVRARNLANERLRPHTI